MARPDEETRFGPHGETTAPGGDVDLLSLLDEVAAAPPAAPAASASDMTGARVAASGGLPGHALLDPGTGESTAQDLRDAMNEALAAVSVTGNEAAQRPAGRPASTAVAAVTADEDSMFESAPVSPRRRRSSAAKETAEPVADPVGPTSAALPGATAAGPPGAAGAQPAAAADVSEQGDDTEAGREEQRHVAVARVMTALGDLLTVCMAPSPDGHAVRHAAEAARSAIAAAGPPWRLRLFGRAVWTHDGWIALDAAAATAAATWTQALQAIGRTTLVCDGDVESKALYEGVRALAIGAHRRAAPNPDGAGALRWIAEPARADAEAFAFAAVDALIELCKELAASTGRWPTERVTDALDLVEQALDARPGGVLRALALGHTDGAAPRHAAEAAILALSALRAVDASTTSARAIAHVALGCALTGTAGGPPPPMAEAAARLSTRLGLAASHDGAGAGDEATASVSQPSAAHGAGGDDELHLHVLRVAALLAWLAAGREGADPAGPDRLARLLHAMVRRRGAEGRLARPWVELCLAERDDRGLRTWAEALPTLLGGTPARRHYPSSILPTIRTLRERLRPVYSIRSSSPTSSRLAMTL